MSELLSAFLDRETSSFHADLTHSVINIFMFFQVEVGNENTCNILLRFIQSDGCSLDCLYNLSSE